MKYKWLLIAFIILIITNSCKKTPTSSEKPNNTAPTASFTITPETGTTNDTFSFDASSSNDNEDTNSELQVRWDWENDGTWDTNYYTTKAIIHPYTTIGTFIVNLEVKDTGGLSNTTTKNVNVLPTASITINPTSGTTATIFSFDASGYTDNEDAASTLEVRWDWENDGTYDTNFSTTKTAVHQYSTFGTFTVKLEVKNSELFYNHAITTFNVRNQYTGTVIDIDGNEYKTIKIGDQEWMAENLKVTRYRNGDPIPKVINHSEWISNEPRIGKYCSYDNDDSNISTYGLLYNYGVVYYDDIAPVGWHVPTDEDWKELEMSLGMSESEADSKGWRGTVEGGKLKATGTTYWNTPNEGATNVSSFSAVPGGFRDAVYGSFNNIGSWSFFWSYTDCEIWSRALYHSHAEINRLYWGGSYGFSIRCIKD